MSRVEGMGELGPKMIEVKELVFDSLFKAAKSEATRAKEEFLDVVERLKGGPVSSPGKLRCHNSAMSIVL